ncbi:MAG TPA: hypothetical protein VIH23_03435, partial [Burkholderiales bacterium]
MDFFAQQDEARRASRRLVLWYLVAAAFVILSFNLAGALGYAVIAIFGLLPLSSAHALDRSECKQYGGSANCWMPVIGPWKHSVCGEWGTGANAVPFDAA